MVDGRWCEWEVESEKLMVESRWLMEMQSQSLVSYLGYAHGEIVLVVIGILPAL